MNPTVPVDVKDAQSKLDAAVIEFEQRFRDRSWNYSGGPRPAYAPTGEQFVERTTGPHPTEVEAIAAWKRMANELADHASPVAILYWRVRPEIAHNRRSQFNRQGWIIYSRFIISSAKVGGAT